MMGRGCGRRGGGSLTESMKFAFLLLMESGTGRQKLLGEIRLC